jgi:hypothetical protein
MNRPEIERARLAIVCIDDCDAGVAQRGVDGQYTHRSILGSPAAYSTWKLACAPFGTRSQIGEFSGGDGLDKFEGGGFTRRIVTKGRKQINGVRHQRINFAVAIMVVCISVANAPSAMATTKGLSQIVTPDLQPKGDLSLSFQIQDERIANPYQLQAELGLTSWAEVAVFRGFQPDEWIFGTEIGLLTKEPFLLAVGFVNWSPHLNVDPQPYIEAGYYTEHHKVIVGAIHAGYKNEAILGYAYDFNERWRLQFDWQSGSENSSTIGFTCNVTPDFQFNPALYVNNGPKHDLFGYIVFTYTFHVWSKGWPPGRIGR